MKNSLLKSREEMLGEKDPQKDFSYNKNSQTTILNRFFRS